MIINLLITMTDVFKVEFGKSPKRIVLSFQLEKSLVRELENFTIYDQEYQTKAKFRGIDIEYRIEEDFISLLKC